MKISRKYFLEQAQQKLYSTIEQFRTIHSHGEGDPNEFDDVIDQLEKLVERLDGAY